MNRKTGIAWLALGLLALGRCCWAASVPTSELEYRSFNSSDGLLPYRLFVPPTYQASQKYPLFIFLHGMGETGTDNEKQLKNQGQGSMYFIDTQWHDTYPMFYMAPQSSGGWGDSHFRRILGAISELRAEFNIDPDRIILSGISMGGSGTWNMLSAYPDYFAAGIPMSFGSGTPRQLTEMPIWTFHAANDGTIGIGGTDSVVKAIRQLGGQPVYTRYASGGHGIWGTAYRSPRLIHWAMAQRRGQRSTMQPVLTITSPTSASSTGSASELFDLAGLATIQDGVTAMDCQIVGRSTTTITPGASWQLNDLKLFRGSNRLVVTATTTSWSTSYAGVTTFNDVLDVAFPTGTPKAIVDVYTGIDGGAVSDLLAAPNYPHNPTATQMIPTTNAYSCGGLNFGSRMRTLVVPPTTGDYRFYVAADDAAEVYLSTDENPANRTRICQHAGYLPNPYTWTRYAQQQSASIPLVAGRAYYLEVLHKQQWGGDYLNVAWSGPGISIGIIEGQYLRLPGSTPPPPVNAAPSVNAGADARITLPQNSVALSASVTDDGLPGSGVTLQWALVSGPASVTFTNAASAAPSVQFSAAGTYVLRLTADDGALQASDELTVTVEPAVALRDPDQPGATASGLAYDYYEGNWSALPDFAVLTPVASGVAPTVSIAPATAVDYFGLRFTGFVQVPTDGVYTFYTSSDDGSRLYIGDTLVVDNDGLHGTVEKKGTIGLKAGRHAIEIQFFERTGGAGVVASWSGPSLTKAAIPAEAYSHLAPNTAPDIESLWAEPAQITLPINIVDLYSLVSDIDGDDLSCAWTKASGPGSVTFSAPGATETQAGFAVAGTYVLRLTVSDGQAQVSEDVTVVVEPAPLPPLRQPENPTGLVNGLDYAYYEGTWDALPEFGALTAKTTGTAADFGVAQAERADYYALRFSGFVDVPLDGEYTFFTSSDDGSRLFIGEELVVDNDGLHAMREKNGTIALAAGRHAVRVEFFEKSGGANLIVSWSGPGLAKAAIPATALYHLAPTDVVPTDGLVLRLDLDETSGDTATDSSGFGNDGILTGGAWDEGVVDGGLFLDGASCISVPDAPVGTIAQAVSVAFWMNPVTWDGTFQHLICNGAFRVYERPFGLSTLEFQLDWGGDYAGRITCPRPTVGEWHHIACTYDGAWMRIYIDGELMAEAPETRSFRTYGSEFTVGAQTGGSNFFMGSLDQVLLYDRGLTAEEVAALAAQVP